MIVSNGNRVLVRGGHAGKLRRNGSMIDILFNRDGEYQWISIGQTYLQHILEKPEHGAEVDCFIEFDEDITRFTKPPKLETK